MDGVNPKGNTNTLETKLLNWLVGQGYTLEMFVARHFQKAGFSVVQSDFYKDTETNIYREIDVRAERFKRITCSDHVLILRIGCDIECKLSQDKPWVLFTTNDQTVKQPWTWYEKAVKSKLGELIFFGLDDEDIAPQNSGNTIPSFLQPEMKKRISYGLTQAFTSGQDIPYKAMISAFKAAESHATYIDKHNESFSSSSGIEEKNIFLNIIFPIVVIGGRLFEAFLDSDGELVTEETTFGIIRWNSPIAGKNNPTTFIITQSAIEELAQTMNEVANKFIASCTKPEIFDVFVKLKKQG